jgi:hypothetical protein
LSSRRESILPLGAAPCLAVALAMAAALAGCPDDATRPPIQTSTRPTQSVTTGPTATWSQPAAQLDGAYSDAGYAVFGGNAVVAATADGKPLKGALVKLYGPTLASATTDANGRASFGPLAAGGDYRLVIEAAGRATYTAGPFEVKKKESTTQSGDLKAEAIVKGRVTAGGQPVAGAVVSDGTNSVLSGADGAYELHGVAPGAVTITASKPRFAVGSQAANAAAGQPGTADLALAAAEPVLYFDTAITPGITTASLATVRADLAAKGWKLSDQPPAREGVWVLVSPSRDLTAAEVERLTTFVAQGGKLVIFGEWGGFGGFRTPAANALVHRFGLHFNPDLLREPIAGAAEPAWLAVSRFRPDAASVGDLKAVQLYESCSLFGLLPMTELAQTGPTGYRVQAGPQAGAHTVAAGGPYKGGKAIVVGDASAFSDDDTDGDQTRNASEAENLRFVERILDW